MTSGCAAKNEKATDPSTDASNTSLTPYSVPVFWNISKENARAGRIL
jgi:hypothetical protein